MERAMKDSRIEWVGQIPEEWDFIRGKYHLTNKKYIPGVHADEYDRLSLTLQGVLPRSKDDAEGLQPKDFYTYQLLRKGELVFKLIDLQNVSTSRVGLSYDTGLVSPAYIVLRGDNDVSTEYLRYFYLMMWHREIFNALGDNGVRSNLGATDLLNVSIPVPPFLLQKKIAAFLDFKCSEIDALRTDIEKEIATLEEYKKSVITEAVTKGLDPNVEMKESGIEWVGNIPAHWNIKRVKYIASSLCKGSGITKEEVFEDGDIQCVRYGEIYSKYNRYFTQTISLTKLQKITAPQMIGYGDILFAGTGELVEEIGKNIVYLGTEPCLAGGDIVVMKHKQNPVFINYAIGSEYAQRQKSEGKAKLKVVHISAFDIANIRLALPSLNEQESIAKELDKKCAIIEQSIDNKKAQIELLDVYKKSIIYEYVTGKKEV